MPFEYLDEKDSKFEYLDGLEQQIAVRKPAIETLREELRTPFRPGLPGLLKAPLTAFKAAAVPFQRVEAGLAVPVLEAQEIQARMPSYIPPSLGVPLRPEQEQERLQAGIERVKEVGRAARLGFSGQRLAEFGDPYRRLGVPEPVAATMGLVTNAALFDVATRGALGQFERFAKTKAPRLMTDRWITQRATDARNIVNRLDDALGRTYADIYTTADNIPVNPSQIDDFILKARLPDFVLNEIDDIVGGRIDTIGKAKQVLQILQKRVPNYVWQEQAIGKGGTINYKITAKGLYGKMKNLMYDSIGTVDDALKVRLQQLDAYAHQNIYPIIKKVGRMVGRKGEVKTGALVSAYERGAKTAGIRELLRKAPQQIRQLRPYVSKELQKDVGILYKNTHKLIRDMSKFKARQAIKRGAGGLARYGIFYRLLRTLGGGGG